MSYIFLDFEFNGTKEEILNLVCGSLNEYDFWLHKREDSKERLRKFILQNKEATFVSWSATAEARCFYSLGLNPMDFKWVDLYLEYKCLSNHNDSLNYGEQLVRGQVKKTTKPRPKWERTEEDSKTAFKPTYSLAEATYKLLGQIRDTEHKNLMRDLIISSPTEFTGEEKLKIMEYCQEDVKYLPELFKAIAKEYKRLLGTDYNKVQLEKEMLFRGRYAALTSIRESKGYPIDVEAAKNFSTSVKSIIDQCQREINQLFPEIKPFKWNSKEGKFSWNQLATRDWLIKNVDTEKWMKTETGNLSLSLEAFERVFDFKHSYPSDNFGAQMVRFLKLKQNVYGFIPAKDKEGFWDSVGSDGRVRPWMNIYGAQSGRSQPKSVSFIFLKPAWVRVLVQPRPGKAICGIDFGSEEFFIQALDSNDEAMIKNYLDGDVYLGLAKLIGMVPPEGKKEDYKTERNICKATELGLSYLMTKYGLSRKLTQDTGRVYTEEQAEELVQLRKLAYPDLINYQNLLIQEYQEKGYIKLPDGWYMWGDNDNFRSVTNVPSQGKGSTIMRYADLLAHQKNLYVPFTLHDALYVEYDSDDLGAIDKLREAMTEGFARAFPKEQRELARKIRLDPFAWSPDYKEDSELVTPNGWKVPCSNKYIDERSQEEYEKFKHYFNKPKEDLL
jgi:hypothetical protein